MARRAPHNNDIDTVANHEHTAKRIVSQACKLAIDGDQHNALLNSKSGVKLLKVELHNLFLRVKQKADERLDNKKGYQEAAIFRRTCTLQGGKFNVQLFWDSKYKNTVKNSILFLRLWKGRLSKDHLPKSTLFKPKMISQREFLFDLDGTGRRLWQEVGGQQQRLSSDELADVFIDTYVSIPGVFK